MTVGQLRATMSYRELLQWGALEEIRKAEREKAEREAKQGMKPRR